MKKATIKANARELLQALIQLKSSVKGSKAKALAATLEVTVTDGKATFVLPGAAFAVNCETQGTAKFTIGFIHFSELVKSQKTTKIEIKIGEQQLSIGIVTLTAKTTFFETDRILRTIQLPINYTDADLIGLLDEGYTKEELEFNNIITKIEDAILRRDLFMGKKNVLNKKKEEDAKIENDFPPNSLFNQKD